MAHIIEMLCVKRKLSTLLSVPFHLMLFLRGIFSSVIMYSKSLFS
uniref:Uncharacterized protein n=1 Tax=Anguilla anguilla TaxID=7936 RepID=A0A0E9S9Z4_ANGAN